MKNPTPHAGCITSQPASCIQVNLSTIGKSWANAIAHASASAPAEILKHHLGSFVSPKAASTLNAPRAHMNQFVAAASVTGRGKPSGSLKARPRITQTTRAEKQTSNVFVQP